MPIVSLANQKGGVGKTTTAVSLATIISQDHGLRVLLIDMDPQANATLALGVQPEDLKRSMYEVLVEGEDPSKVLLRTSYGVDLLPSNLDLAGAEVILMSRLGREAALSMAIEPIVPEYDLILIDTPPSLGVLTTNALFASTHIIVPVQAQYYALRGLNQLFTTLDLMERSLKRAPEVLGFLLTMVERTVLARDVEDLLLKRFGERVFKTKIPKNVRLAEAPSHLKPITHYAPDSPGAKAYRQLAGEVLERLGLLKEVMG